MDHHKEWVRQVFDDAAADYGEKSSAYFTLFGKRLVELAEIQSNQSVLDVATGKGALLFPLSEKVGPSGKVIGVDISSQMLQATLQTVQKRGLKHVELHQMDAEHLTFADNSFDAVTCGFALFFFPSLTKALSEFRRVLKPGGTLAVSVWGEDTLFDTIVTEETERLQKTKTLIATPLSSGEALEKSLKEANFQTRIIEERQLFPHLSPEEFWESLWGHGTRSRLEQLTPEQLSTLRARIITRLQALKTKEGLIEEIHLFYGIAQKLV